MILLEEGELRIEIPAGISARKFDKESHGFMKAVDIVIEDNKRMIFLEIKDPNNRSAKDVYKDEWFEKNLKTEKNDSSYYYKYRDSFIYEWASGRIDASKRYLYCILIALDYSENALLMAKNETLKRKLPVGIPEKTNWKKAIADSCMVLNLESWNKHFSEYRIYRSSTLSR